jgi:acetoacetate decarboxylase
VNGHPPAPWRLQGELTIVPAAVRVADARRFPIPPGVRVLSVAGVTAGGVMLARYTAGTLRYHELIVFSALARLGGRLGMVVSHIYVDSEESLHGGREIWGLPKELASFSFARDRFEARQDGRVLLSARLRRRRGRLPLALLAPTLGERGGAPVHAVGHARVRAAPALVTLEVPGGSPFAALGLAGTRVALAGDDLRLVMAAP